MDEEQIRIELFRQPDDLSGVFRLCDHAQVVFDGEEFFQPQAEDPFPFGNEDSDLLVRLASHWRRGWSDDHSLVPRSDPERPNAPGFAKYMLDLLL